MTGPNPTDRAKLGTRRHVLTDGQGIPLSVVITSANTHDMKAAMSVLDNIVVKRPSSKINKEKQNLCLDKGYDFLEIENSVIKKGYCPHIPHRGEQTITNHFPRHRSRRWVVERTNSWHNRFRKLLVRYKEKLGSYFAIVCVCLDCCIIIYRRIILG